MGKLTTNMEMQMNFGHNQRQLQNLDHKEEKLHKKWMKIIAELDAKNGDIERRK